MPAKAPPPPQRRGPLDLPPRAQQALIVVEETAVNLTHLDKIYFPDGTRKRDLLDYSHDVAEFLLPHLRDRPYTMKRYPEGIAAPPFFQKNAGAATPAWVRTVAMPSGNEKEKVNYILCNDLPTLLYVVNAGCIDHNVWLSRASSPFEPDVVLLDLDPGPATAFGSVVRLAQAIGRLLEEFEIVGCLKTSGATGLHVWIPIPGGATFQQSQQFAALLLRLAAAAQPELVTEIWRLGARPPDRVYLDYRQNAHGKTIPPPYSPRPLPGAPVSCPLHWHELRLGLDPARFNLQTIRRRLDRYGDLFAPALPGARHEPLAALFGRLQARNLAAD
ncbi:MAG TPA: hypothetical protein VNF74_01815 [Terriglobales bacterium]|nr:hypothetical protein [Terriglobales bacterium]